MEGPCDARFALCDAGADQLAGSVGDGQGVSIEGGQPAVGEDLARPEDADRSAGHGKVAQCFDA